MPRPAVFLDRDGTVNVEKGYVHRAEDWEWIPGSVEAIRRLNQLRFVVVVVSNQAGVARGYFDDHVVQDLHRHVNEELRRCGAYIDAFYFCPHHPAFASSRECQCRKPAPGLILSAQRDLDLELQESWLVGDKASDIAAADAAGVRPILVRTGYGTEQRKQVDASIPCVESLRSAVEYIAAVRECPD